MSHKIKYSIWRCWRGLTKWLRWYPPIGTAVIIIRYPNEIYIGDFGTMCRFRDCMPWNPFLGCVETLDRVILPVYSWEVMDGASVKRQIKHWLQPKLQYGGAV